MSKIDDLLKEKKRIEKEIELEKQKEIDKNKAENLIFAKSIPEDVKNWLLKNTKHICSSCNNDDEYPNNGFRCGEEHFRCPRCALAEYFNYDYLQEDYKLELRIDFIGADECL